jgi:monofunctional biosynthetic peptidoglycan transglycosylase
MKKRTKKNIRKAGTIILKALLIFFLFSLLQVLYLKWSDPSTSLVMIQRQIKSIFSESKDIRYRWFNYDAISKEMALAVVASEDQNFPNHFGFDLEQINKAIKEKERRGRLRGASTITQQVAKNLFLWEGKSFIRKGLEAYYTILIEALWTKKRILEIYLNIAEMGDCKFGVGAASEIYFKKLPGKLTRSECALIAAVLPNPVRFSVTNPSGYTRKRQNWILRQMESLGGISYIKDI